jgi:MFS family permease
VSGPRVRLVLFGSGLLLGLIAEQLVLFAVPLLIFQRTGEVSTLGLAYAVEWLPALLAYPLAGLVADRDGGRRLFCVASLVRAGALVTAATMCLLLPGLTTPILIAGGVILSLMMAPVRMSVEKMVLLIAGRASLAHTQSVVQNMELLAMALGPTVAVVAVVAVGKLWLLFGAAAAFVLAAVCWLPLPRGLRATEPATVRGTIGELRLGMALLLGNPPIRLLAVLNFSINLVLATVLAANAALVTGVFAAPESSFGLLNACVGVTGFLNLLAIPMLLRRVDVRALGVFGFAVLCTALLALGLAPTFAVYGVSFVAALAGVAYFNVYNRTQRVQVIPKQHLGKVMGPFYLINLLSLPIGGLLIAVLGSTVAPQTLVTILAVLLTAVGGVLLRFTMASFSRKLRDLDHMGVPA